jgi:hypothetical protein
MIKKFIKIFVVIDIAVVVFCLLQGQMIWLLNTQIAFFSSLIITIGSFLGYQNNIKSRISKQQVDLSDPDKIDKIEDPFDLYSDDPINYDEISKEEAKTIIQDEKKRIKQHTFKNFFYSFGAASSIYRIVGYIGLVIGFFYLVNNKLFNTYAYMFGLIVVPIGALVVSFILRSKED